MPEKTIYSNTRHLTRIEPSDRLVVLARTIEARGTDAEAHLKDNLSDLARYGETCVGQALYRHRAVFRDASEAPVWSHLELRYFRDIVPAEVIYDLVIKQQPAGVHVLRAELLLTTPSAFVMPRGWQGSRDHPEWQSSLEFIDVRLAHLGEYRDIMRNYIGPAAAKAVEAGGIGTFRTMETAAVLHQDPGFNIGWNQIHLCEVDADDFKGFGHTFDSALREISPDGSLADVFSDLDTMRTIPRWTFNDPVVEADATLGQLGSA